MRKRAEEEKRAQEEKTVAMLRHAAIGERVVATVHANLLEAQTAEALWAAVRRLGVAMGVPGVCLILRGRLFEFRRPEMVGTAMGTRVRGGRLVVLMDPICRQAGMTLIWVVRRALEEGAGKAQ